MTHLYIFPDGVQRVVHNEPVAVAVPRLMQRYGVRRAVIVCSKSLRDKTGVISGLAASLGDKVIGVIDDVGEHSPLQNVLAGARKIRDLGADIIVSVGGGSVLDFSKFVQLCITENVYEREALLQFQWAMSDSGDEILSTSHQLPAIRQIAVPTTLATAEWTPGGTPLDEVTGMKARLMATAGAPLAIVYDPSLLRHTPLKLLAATGIRGLDHAINTACADDPHPFTTLLCEQAIVLYIKNLRRLREPGVPDAVYSDCQLATWYTGMGQFSMSHYHGFSHFMVHVLAPYAHVGHSDAACVLMLAQARWLESAAREQHARILELLRMPGRRFADVLHELLVALGLPTTLSDLGMDAASVEGLVPLALAHPMVTKHNLRPVTTAQDIRDILSLVQ